MKFTVDVDCTPEEARRFLGLPDVAAMQERLMKQMEEKMRENIEALDPETAMKTWLPLTIKGWEDMQKAFWGQLAGGSGQGEK